MNKLIENQTASRIMAHIKAGYDVVFISACKDIPEDDYNTEEMKNIVKEYGFGFTNIDGLWTSTNMQEKSKEKSIMISNKDKSRIGDLYDLATELARTYNQVNVLLKFGNDYGAWFFYPKGNSGIMKKTRPEKEEELDKKGRWNKHTLTSILEEDGWKYAGTFHIGLLQKLKNEYTEEVLGYVGSIPKKGSNSILAAKPTDDVVPYKSLKDSKLFKRVYNLRLLTEELGEETMDLFEQVREGKVKFVDSQAYWISPSGEITSVGLKHINEIIDNPEAFGLTKEFVKETYAKFGEKMNTEGKAREEIMALLMKQGWIRIRYQPRQDSFTVQLWRLGRRPKDLIWSWANAQEESNSKRSYSDVVILLLGEDNRVIRTSVNGIVREELLDENEKKEAKRLYEHLKWVNSSSEFTKPSCYLSE